MGSNHIWKTSSGNNSLKSHFTVSQRLGGKDNEGIFWQKGDFIHNGHRWLLEHVENSVFLPSDRRKFVVSQHSDRGDGVMICKSLLTKV
jgi:hypothetical protein